MIVKYKNKIYNSFNDNNVLNVNVCELYYRNIYNPYNITSEIKKLDYTYIKYTSEDFCIYLNKNRISNLSVDTDTFDLEWDKNDSHTNILETDDNDGILEFI